MKKKILACLISTMIAVTSLAGCGTAGSNENQTGNSEVNIDIEKLVEEKVVQTDYDLDAAFAKETGVGEPIRIISTFEGTCQVQSQIAYLLGFYDAEGLKEGVDYSFVESGGET